MSSSDSPLLPGGTLFAGPVRVEGVAVRLSDCHSGFNIQKCSRGGCIRDAPDLSQRMITSECHVTLGLTLCPGFVFVVS